VGRIRGGNLLTKEEEGRWRPTEEERQRPNDDTEEEEDEGRSTERKKVRITATTSITDKGPSKMGPCANVTTEYSHRIRSRGVWLRIELDIRTSPNVEGKGRLWRFVF
jgi:hypothetical protein